MTIKTWQERCETHPDHDGVVTNDMIVARMQEEIDDLRGALELAVAIFKKMPKVNRDIYIGRDSVSWGRQVEHFLTKLKGE